MSNPQTTKKPTGSYRISSTYPFTKKCEAKGHKEAKLRGANTGWCWECNGGPTNYVLEYKS